LNGQIDFHQFDWPQSLRSAPGIMSSTRYPIALNWVPEFAPDAP
jgi:hypothetical protein